jgi:hypothetical protein
MITCEKIRNFFCLIINSFTVYKNNSTSALNHTTMKILIQLLLFVFLIIKIESKYEVILDRSEQLDDKTYWDIGTLRVRKFNRSR